MRSTTISLVATPEQFMIKGGSNDHVGRYIYNTDLSHIEEEESGGVVWNGDSSSGKNLAHLD